MRYAICLVFTLVMINLQGQDTMKLSLADALNYANTNNTGIQNAATDVEISKQTVNQVFASGLPQVSANANMLQYTQVPGSWVKNFVPTSGAPEYVFIRFQQPVNANATLSMNQLIYSGTFLLGLKAAKEFMNVNKLMLEKTKSDVSLNVAKSYLMALTLQKNITLINANITMLEKTLKDVTALNKEGFAEKLDVQRLEFSLSNLKVQRDKLGNGYGASLNYLKFQLGMNVQNPIALTDDIETIDKTIPAAELTFDIKNRLEYQLLNQSYPSATWMRSAIRLASSPRLLAFCNISKPRSVLNLIFLVAT